MEQITGVGIYPIISLLMFVVFFVIVTYWVFSIDKREIERVERFPLDDH